MIIIPPLGTHNSITGEPGRGILSWFLTPFARCQRKTILAQLHSGVRYFDLRVALCSDGQWRGAHGPWTSRRTIHEIIQGLEIFGEHVWADITLERGTDTEAFLALVSELRQQTARVHLRRVNVKKPSWQTLHVYYTCMNDFPINQCFRVLDGSSWHTYLPIPRLWHALYSFPRQEGCINTYDFL